MGCYEQNLLHSSQTQYAIFAISQSKWITSNQSRLSQTLAFWMVEETGELVGLLP